MIKRVGGVSYGEAEGLLRRALGRFRLPLRGASDVDQTAARNRAERLFEVNFRHPWTR